MPHTMKRIFFYIAFAIVAISFTSCLTSEEHSTPIIGFSRYLYRDTPAGVHDSLLYGDTINVGDTLRGNLLLYGGYNNLTEFTVKVDTADLDLQLLIDSGYSVFLDTVASKPAQGYLRFAQDTYIFPTAMRFVPKKTGDLKISLTLASTAGERFSPVNAWFTMPVR